jgi:hypothetical protein
LTDIVPFGQYKDQPISVLLADGSYCEWLQRQPWFLRRYPAIAETVELRWPPGSRLGSLNHCATLDDDDWDRIRDALGPPGRWAWICPVCRNGIFVVCHDSQMFNDCGCSARAFEAAIAERLPPVRKCHGVRKNGKPCTTKVVYGTDFCAVHQVQGDVESEPADSTALALAEQVEVFLAGFHA